MDGVFMGTFTSDSGKTSLTLNFQKQIIQI